MGDAAHATSPSIGMGMNTALRDAQIFHELLQRHGDDFEMVLPAFSQERVKEGNSLSDLAFYLYCLDPKHQMIETLHMVIRSKLSSMFPMWVDEHPQMMIGRRGVSLSEVYEKAVQQGIIKKHRIINDRIRMENFEKESGMIRATYKKSISMEKRLIMGAIAFCSAAICYQIFH